MKCIACGSPRVYPSRLRNAYERIRESLTAKQPHRCHECGRRAWADVEILKPGDDGASEIRPDDLRANHDAPPVAPQDLDNLDPIRTRR
jgi:DNA-directed RNA polymerase subunit RPC12/RpoP